MTFLEPGAAWWWPYVFILIAGAFATEIWRWLGVIAGDKLRDDSEALVWVKAVATALVAAVVGKLIIFPTGALSGAPLALRMFAALAGWFAFARFKNSILAGVLVAEAVLIGGWLLTDWIG